MSFDVTSMMSHCYTFLNLNSILNMKYWSNSSLLGEIVAGTPMSLSLKNRMKKVGSEFRLSCTFRKKLFLKVLCCIKVT